MGRRVVAVRIVIADDDWHVNELMAVYLERAGFEVVGRAMCGDEAVQMVKQQVPDVVLLDIGMPVMDGMTACRQIAAEQPTAVLFVTARDGRVEMEIARDAGAMAYLTKPFHPPDLVEGIKIAMRRWRETLRMSRATLDPAEDMDVQGVAGLADGGPLT